MAALGVATAFSDDGASDAAQRELRFFRTLITVMAVVQVAGFVVQLAAGRSSFAAPLVIHAHAFAFMGWVAIVVAQAWLAGSGNLAMHRRLGMLAAFWPIVLVVLGLLVSSAVLAYGLQPPFFKPKPFTISNQLGLFAFAGLFYAAIALRHRRDWHPRLQVGAFMLLMGPGFGRLLPLPILGPYAFEIASGVAVVYALVAMARDQRVHGRVHPAWLWSIGVLAVWLIGARLMVETPLGDAWVGAAKALGSNPAFVITPAQAFGGH